MEFPLPGGPATTVSQINVGTTTSYNQPTESGTTSVTQYNAGSGTFCNGSVFVNTAGASPTATFTAAFTISQFGNRSDTVILTFEAEPISDVSNVVISGYANRQ